MARRKKSETTAAVKPVNPIAVRKSSRQIARKQSTDCKKLNGELSIIKNPEVEKIPEDPKPPEIVVKRKRGRPRLSAPKPQKNRIEDKIDEAIIKNEIQTVDNSGEKIDEDFDKMTPVFDKIPSVCENIEAISEEIVNNSAELNDGTWTTEDVIEETIICEEMEVEGQVNNDYNDQDDNVVLEQVLLMNEQNYDANNVVYVIQNEDGTESMVMPSTNIDNNYNENEYQIIEDGVDCLSVDDIKNSENSVSSDKSEFVCENLKAFDEIESGIALDKSLTLVDNAVVTEETREQKIERRKTGKFIEETQKETILPEDSGNSNMDSSSNPSISSSEQLLMTLQNDDASLENLESEIKDYSEDANPFTNRLEILDEKNCDEELSRESEIDKTDDDVKFSNSNSDNSNDTGSLSSVKTQEASEKSSGALDFDKKDNFRSRSGSTDTTGSESGSNSSAIRRSSRIRSQGLMKQRSRGRGLVTKPIADVTKAIQLERDKLQISQVQTQDSQSETQSDKENSKLLTDLNTVPILPGYDSDSKPVKVKSRWRRSSELEMGSSNTRINFNSGLLNSTIVDDPVKTMPDAMINSVVNESEGVKDNEQNLSSSPVPKVNNQKLLQVVNEETDKEMEERLSQFELLKENMYLTERYTNKETKRMTCDCFLTDEEFERGELGCGEDCLNRLLMIECGSRCNINERCTNKRFQNCEYAKCEVFRTEKKGLGLRASADLGAGEFIMEYVGEVLDPKDFRKRAKEYSKDKNKHYYFMALKSDQIIDATMKGNISRFINHSCDPNAETQKWTVNGELRIGFFNRRFIAAGEEITFDYHFQRYGKEAQKCYCEAATCRGWIGDTPDEEKEKIEKKEKRERENVKKKREVKKSFMEDEDLEEEIDKLCSGGLKNRAHTLTLSRLMVRSREIDHRMRLLKVIQDGDQACRRLFLDYHGLRLIWSYMMDIASIVTNESQLFRLELLRTLGKLPIPNKTMLMDSKVYGVVEKWSKQLSNSPKVDSPEEDVKSKVEELDCDSEDKIEINKSPIQEASESQDNAEADNIRMIIELATNLLGEWSNLKEVFRIPKKERIEQMKEHEREADSGYREDTEKDDSQVSSYERQRNDRYGRRDEARRRGRESPDPELFRKDKERTNLVAIPKLSKYERRQLFAMRVAKEEEERCRRQQQELYQVHESKCMALGLDPLATPVIDSQMGYPMFFNPNIGQWQPFPIQDNTELNHNPMFIGNANSLPSGANQLPDISPVPPVYGINQPPGYPPPVVNYPGLSQPFGDNQVQNNVLGNCGTAVPTSIYADKNDATFTGTEVEDANDPREEAQGDVPPIELPPKWKYAKDGRGRYYYYHVKERISQWLPPPPTHIGVQAETSSSEESSEETSSSEEDDEAEELEEDKGEDEGVGETGERSRGRGDPRTAAGGCAPEVKRRRDGLVQERIISPRREEDRVDHKKYKDIKDKLRRQKERVKLKEHIDKMRKHRRANKAKSQARHTAIKLQAIAQSNELTAERKIKDSFRVNMATVMVKFLNPYRQSDCKQGRITNTEDFKYLARKLTHFVMAKELKHCKSVDELQCNENVKHKAKDFVRKYMNKFGPIYQRSSDDD